LVEVFGFSNIQVKMNSVLELTRPFCLITVTAPSIEKYGLLKGYLLLLAYSSSNMAIQRADVVCLMLPLVPGCSVTARKNWLAICPQVDVETTSKARYFCQV